MRIVNELVLIKDLQVGDLIVVGDDEWQHHRLEEVGDIELHIGFKVGDLITDDAHVFTNGTQPWAHRPGEEHGPEVLCDDCLGAQTGGEYTMFDVSTTYITRVHIEL